MMPSDWRINIGVRSDSPLPQILVILGFVAMLLIGLPILLLVDGLIGGAVMIIGFGFFCIGIFLYMAEHDS